MELELLDNGNVVESIDFGRPDVGSKNFKVLELKNNSRLWPINNIKLSEMLD